MMTRVLLLLVLAIVLPGGVSAIADDPDVLSHSFEFRYVSDDPRASGPTDFKGETEIFSTEERVDFLERFANYSKNFFNDPDLDTDVVPMSEAQKRLNSIKGQPLPQVRRRIPLTQWQWLGYREGENNERATTIESWASTDVHIENGALVASRDNARIERTFEALGWRFFLEWRAKWEEDGWFSLMFGDAATVAVKGDRIGYVSEGSSVDAMECDPGTWHSFKLEVDLVEQRYNLMVDGVTVADFASLASGDVTDVQRFTVEASEGVQLDDFWGVGYTPTDEPRMPYTIDTFMDESFQLKPDIDGWFQPEYDDSAWDTAQTPVIHGGERYAGEDLYLRTRVDVRDVQRATLRFEGVEPEADLFINGQHAANIPSPVPTEIDVTSHLVPNATNTVALRVHHTKPADPYSSHCPSDVHVGWYAGRMWLDVTAPVFIDDIRIHAETIGDPAYLQPHITLKNESAQKFSGTLSLTATRWFPNESDSASGSMDVPVEIAPGDESVIERILAIHDPALWSPQSPNLYKISAVLRDNEKRPIDDNVITMGVRTVGQGGGTFRINGEPALSTGALLLGYRPPLSEIVLTRACTPDEWIVRELMQIQRMGANTARTGFLLGETPRFAEIGDQLGVMFIWSTPAGRWWGDPLEVDFETYPAYMRQVYNHPSVMMWEVTNEPTLDSYDQLNTFYAKAYDTLYPVDSSRLICLCTNIKYSKYSGNDSGTIDMEGNPNPYPHVPEWSADMVTRAHHIHITGYGEPWTTLRNWPGPEIDFLNSTERAYFNTEHEESIGQPNWSFDKGKPSYKVHSYEWEYDEGSIGRKLTSDEWQTSQAWQAFSAYESMRWQRLHDVDGFSWCSLHGGGNSNTYQKPLMDYYGHAKLAYWAVKMANQDVLAGSADVDVVYGPGDSLASIVLNLGEARTVNVIIRVKNMAGETIASTVYEGVGLSAGRTMTELPPWHPEVPVNDHYAVEYIVRDANE